MVFFINFFIILSYSSSSNTVSIIVCNNKVEEFHYLSSLGAFHCSSLSFIDGMEVVMSSVCHLAISLPTLELVDEFDSHTSELILLRALDILRGW
jgi:hypothetical protein